MQIKKQIEWNWIPRLRDEKPTTRISCQVHRNRHPRERKHIPTRLFELIATGNNKPIIYRKRVSTFRGKMIK